jgi:hypothetical protein
VVVILSGDKIVLW